MPIVKRASDDYWSYLRYGHVDYMVNPANTKGIAGAGLSKEFRDRCPSFYPAYKSLCESGQFKIGKIFTHRDKQSMPYSILTVATKDDYRDASRIEYVKRALQAMREYLTMENGRRSKHTVVMPMLGTGLGQLSVHEVEPLIYDYLDDLDNVIHLSMRPDAFVRLPRYLAIIGSRRVTDYAYVERCVLGALSDWGMTWSDFDAVISGGATGVDTVACGIDRRDSTASASLAGRYHTHPPVICKADWDRFASRAGMIRNKTVIDIATHVIGISKTDVESRGTPAAILHAHKINTDANAVVKNIRTYGNDDWLKWNTPLSPQAGIPQRIVSVATIAHP
jgi:O-acetyl-ADP-ribose deacetylase (regulator of RNase III)